MTLRFARVDSSAVANHIVVVNEEVVEGNKEWGKERSVVAVPGCDESIQLIVKWERTRYGGFY